MKKITTLLLALIAVKLSWAQSRAITAAPITIGTSITIHSSILSETRIINIYLPQGYEQDTGTYSVIYLLDGGLDEDFIHVAGLVQFNTFPWVNILPKTIVVGIANNNRERDMTFATTVEGDKKLLKNSGGSAEFISFIEKELQPYILQNYRINDSKTLIGESLAGLLATEILFKKPDLFNNYIIVSPSLWWDNGSLLNYQITTMPKTVKNVYIGVGKEGLAPTKEPHVMEVDANLLAEKIIDAWSDKVNLHFDYLPDKNHATVGHQAVSNAMQQLSKH